MSRTFCPHPRRPRVPLAAWWRFRAVAAGPPPARPRPATAADERIPVPAAWEGVLAHHRHRGAGWYWTDIELPRGRSRIHFDAVAHTGRVWLDGRFLGDHYGAHTDFAFFVDSPGGPHRLTVWVSNAFSPDNPLTAAYQDIYTYGGIVRPVTVEALPAVHFETAQAWAVRRRNGWALAVRARLGAAASGGEWPERVTLRFDGRPLATLPIGRGGSVEAEVDLPPVRRWSPERPVLYSVELEAGEDLWRERIGFRTFACDGPRLLLNDRPIFLQGINRHEGHPDFGPALPPAIRARDVEILKKLGANFVRGSHYPNDPAFLDLCDEHGLLVWEELAHWQPKEEHLRSPRFLTASLRQVDEMVTRDRHHPSVVLWGMLNEADTHRPAARRVVRRLAQRFRQLDPSRPVTFASNHPFDDLCVDLVDVASLNLYPGWYVGELPDTVAVVQKQLASFRRKAGRRPILFSEFGAGAMDGVRSFEQRKWTEGYQAELLRRVITTARDSGRVAGVVPWQYCDVRTSEAKAMTRVREYNNKGIVTEYREPKEAYWALREQYARPAPAIARSATASARDRR